MRKRPPVPQVAIIGPGRVGQALGHLLAQAHVPIAFVAARRLAAARRAARFMGQGEPISLADPRLQSAAVLLITTSDSALGGIARQLAKMGGRRNGWRGKVVLHTCGSLSSAVLHPLQARGAAIGSLHPYQTVPSPQAGVRNLRGTFWALEGDRPALRVARDWVKRLAGTAFPIRASAKTLYHLSAFIVSPTTVTLMAEAMSLLEQAGVPPRISRPMLRQFVAETIKNFADLGARGALTGPAVRGDWATIRRHLTALRSSDPAFVPVYRSLLKAMLRLVPTGSPAPGSEERKSKAQLQKSKGKSS